MNQSGNFLGVKRQIRWYYTTRGEHVHIRVFMKGAKLGDICMAREDFRDIRDHGMPFVNMIEDRPASSAFREAALAS